MCWTHPNSIANQLARQRSQVTVRQSQPVRVEAREIESQWIPMPQEAVDAMLGILSPEWGDTLYDLGCGDGRILISANLDYGCSVLGIENNPRTYLRAEKNVKAHCEGWAVIYDDATRYPLDKADFITVYLNPEVSRRMRWATLRPGARVISYQHPIPGLECEVHSCRIDGVEHTFYLHKRD